MGIKYLHSIPHFAVAQEVHHTVLHGVELCEQLSGAVGGAGERIVNDHGSYMRAVLYHAVDAVQQAAAAGEDHAVYAEVDDKLGRRALKHGEMCIRDSDKVGVIIAKDMSRIGRNYLEVGLYTEMLFPEHDVRFIAVNSGVDSTNQQDNDFTPFLNIINEFYVKDSSKKVKAVMKQKGESGEYLTTNPPYGYMKDPDNPKRHWIVDDEAAAIVRQIFAWCMDCLLYTSRCV